MKASILTKTNLLSYYTYKNYDLKTVSHDETKFNASNNN